MSLKCLGSLTVLLGVLIILVQILQIGGNAGGTGPLPTGLLFLDVPDLVCSGLWGGTIILSAGILAILNKPAFQTMSVLSILCGVTIAGLHIWSLMRMWHWSRQLGPWANCTDLCQTMVIARPLMCLLGFLVVLVNSILLCKKVESVKFAAHFDPSVRVSTLPVDCVSSKPKFEGSAV